MTHRWHRLGLTHATVVAYLALFVAIGGTAVAATGGSFLLGKANKATTTTSLTNTKGTALALKAKAGSPPLSVTSGIKVRNLNSDKLDGLDSTSLQKRVTGTCPAGQAIRAVGAGGSVSCMSVRGGITIVERTERTSISSAPVGSKISAIAWCAPGEDAVGGGWFATNDGQVFSMVGGRSFQNATSVPGHIGDAGYEVLLVSGANVAGGIDVSVSCV